jgi:hypothetical protein
MKDKMCECGHTQHKHWGNKSDGLCSDFASTSSDAFLFKIKDKVKSYNFMCECSKFISANEFEDFVEKVRDEK